MTMSSAVVTPSPMSPESAWNEDRRARDAVRRKLFSTRMAELDVAELPVIGRVPSELRGAFYQNGPGAGDVFGDPDRCSLDGDGGIIQFRFTERGVSFSSRFVRTPRYLAERRAGRRIWQTYGTPAASRPWQNLLAVSRLKVPMNVNVQPYEGHLLAMNDGRRPFRIDPVSLATGGEEDFGGAVPRTEFFGAHPHVVHGEGATWYHSLDLVRPRVRLWRVVPGRRAELFATRPLASRSFLHDFAMSKRAIVLPEAPWSLDPLLAASWALLGLGTLYRTLRWDADKPLILHRVDKSDPTRLMRYELPAGLVMHAVNAYDERDDVIVDACVTPSAELFDTAIFPHQEFRPSYAHQYPRLRRYRLGPSGRLTEIPMPDVCLEMPTVNPLRAGLRHRYGYGMAFDFPSRVRKVDFERGSVSDHEFGEWCMAFEPLFVPRPGAIGEDDGWVLTVVYDSRAHTSSLHILGAQTLEPVAQVPLPTFAPFRFHGCFIPSNP